MHHNRHIPYLAKMILYDKYIRYIRALLLLDNMEEINDIDNRADIVFSNLLTSTLQYSNMHMRSYRILSMINNIYIGLLIIGCILTSILSIINMQHQFTDPSTYSAIIEIIIAALLSLYKYSMLPENVQSHYHYHNEFQILYMRLNTIGMVLGTPHSIYINKYEAIKDITEKCDLLLRDAPAFPWYIRKVVANSIVVPNNVIEKIIDKDRILPQHNKLNEFFYST